MKIEDLKNTKIYLSNKDDRVKFQEKVLKLGVTWTDCDRDNTFFIIDEHLDMFIGWGESTFIDKREKQIFLDEVLAIEEPKEEHKFKPFDKVLMSDGRSPQWIPTLFACYYDSEKYPYMDITSILYSKCIPYEGNEHLVGQPKI